MSEVLVVESSQKEMLAREMEMGERFISMIIIVVENLRLTIRHLGDKFRRTITKGSDCDGE